MLTEDDYADLENERIYLHNELAEASTDMTMSPCEWHAYKEWTVERIREIGQVMYCE